MTALGQELKVNLFSRTLQIFNYDISKANVSYNSALSIGAGISNKSKFIELATLISIDDIYGLYTFFGTSLFKKSMTQNFSLFTNLFGEVTYIPNQAISSGSIIYTSGICFFLNRSFDWGSIGYPICISGHIAKIL